MAEDLISVIVPVYNVERYLKRCVDSILAQSYSNLEILLVDDGSTDRSGALCDAYAQQDSRIICIHKKNGGLSDARNTGMEHAKGTLFCFVDSDDFIDRRMLEVLHTDLTEQGAEMSAVGFQKFTEEAQIRTDDGQAEVQTFDSRSAVRSVLEDEKLGDFAWNKLYRRELFEEIRYPYGRMMEDAGTTYRLFEKCSKIVYRPLELYYYYQRPDSILHRRTQKFYEDKFDMGFERYLHIRAEYPDMLENDAAMLRNIEHCYPYLIRDAGRRAKMEQVLREFRPEAETLLDAGFMRKYKLLQRSRWLYTALFLLKNGKAADRK